jgi:hypothetical protein
MVGVRVPENEKTVAVRATDITLGGVTVHAQTLLSLPVKEGETEETECSLQPELDRVHGSNYAESTGIS